MSRTDTERFTEAVNYLRALSPALATDVVTNTPGRAAQLGASISLEGAGYWKSGTANQHSAVRALLLCHQVYLKPPYAKTDLATSGDAAKSSLRTKTEDQVKRAILCYLPTLNPTLEGFARAAEAIKKPNGDFVWETRTRDDQTLGPNPVCFNAVKVWLFNAGFVSLRWLATKGMLIDAHRANSHLGDGQIIQKDQVKNIPRGQIFNFHVNNHKEVCHWGVSLGSGWAAGANTTPSAAAGGVTKSVNFRNGGNSVYGEFTLESSAEVCKLKYTPHGQPVQDITIRQIDPTAVGTYF